MGKREIDKLTKKPIVDITTKKGFVNAVINETPVIRTKGEFAHKCYKKMCNSKKFSKVGKLALIGDAIPLFDIISAADLLLIDLGTGLSIINITPAAFAAASVIGVSAISAIIDGKKFKKYEAEIVSEDEIMFRLKYLKKYEEE